MIAVDGGGTVTAPAPSVRGCGLLSREKATPDTLERARGYAEEALEWLKTAGRVSAINVRAEQLHQGWLYLYIALTLPDGSVIPYEFKAAFNGV